MSFGHNEIDEIIPSETPNKTKRSLYLTTDTRHLGLSVVKSIDINHITQLTQ